MAEPARIHPSGDETGVREPQTDAPVVVSESTTATDRVTVASPVRDEVYELYRDVLDARDRARISQPIGDESELDLLAMRDHVLGLEAELVNARKEAAHYREIADALRAELRHTLRRPAVRGSNLALRAVGRRPWPHA